LFNFIIWLLCDEKPSPTISCTCYFLVSYGIAAIAPFSHRLAFDDLPADIQRLRCKVNFEALVFLPYIISLGRTLEKRLRSPVQGHSTELAQQRVEENTNQAGKYAVLHLRFDKVNGKASAVFELLCVLSVVFRESLLWNISS
jgi:hypothetical protein